ncbi:MAG: sodium:calcium antiporter, partial [Roseovarius sp.]
GALMTAVVTSLPELVTTLAAVRRGALQLAVGGIIGGNSFDVLFLTLSDFGYREGSLYHAIGQGDLFWLIVGQAMTAILLLGLIVRERQGPGGIGWESVLMLSIYGGAVGFQAWSG